MFEDTKWVKIRSHKNRGMNPCVPEGFEVSASHVTSAVLLLNDTNII